MLQQLPIGAFVPWTPSNGGASIGPIEIKMANTPVQRSIFYGQKVGLVYGNAISRLRPEILCCRYERPNPRHGTNHRLGTHHDHGTNHRHGTNHDHGTNRGLGTNHRQGPNHDHGTNHRLGTNHRHGTNHDHGTNHRLGTHHDHGTNRGLGTNHRHGPNHDHGTNHRLGTHHDYGTNHRHGTNHDHGTNHTHGRDHDHGTNHFHETKKRETLPQNVDLPPILPKKKKKPYPIPIKKIQEAARADKKLAQMGIEKHLEPPKNGILVSDLIPVAHEVLDAWKVLIRGVAQLLHVIPVHACSECSEFHVAQTGHEIQDCRGPTCGSRRSYHAWIKGSINDILTPIESYHMYDPFGRRIKHETRLNYDRIPAVVELCIQAGVEFPEYPSRRRTEPIRMLGKKVIELGGYVDEPRLFQPGNPGSQIVEFDTYRALERFPPPTEHEVPRIAQDTIIAYEKVGWGVRKLMKKYSVKACGYCPEVHVGPWGHNVKLCGEFKHQWRDGKHGWQDATVDEVFPPNFVWHVEEPKGPPLKTTLKRFYGKVPAVVEVCMQAGARVPNRYKPMMRVDIVVPEKTEANLVA